MLHDGLPAAYLERGGRSLVTFSDADPTPWVEALVRHVKDGRVRRMELHRIDGGPVHEHPAADALRAAGFADAYRGLVLRG